MSLRPIDMAITIQRTPEVNRSQSNENVRPEVAHQQFADRLHREVQQQDQQVTQSNKAEENNINRDGRGNAGGGDSARKRKPKKNAKTSEADAPSGGGGSMFDVSI